MKERLDVLLVKRNLASSREKAKAIIMSGNVFVEGQREDKAGTTFPDTVNIIWRTALPGMKDVPSENISTKSGCNIPGRP